MFLVPNKSTGKTMGAVRGKGLTAKQLHFARCVASGMKQAEAYREAYNAENMQASTVHEKASRLMAQDKIRARVDVLVGLREKALMRSTVDVRTKVLRKLEDMMDSAEPADSVKLRATELLGKTIGLFRDVIEDNRNADLSSEELKEQLRELIGELETSQGESLH
jgi:hypothetical protein